MRSRVERALRRDPARRDGDRQSDDQKSRQMMRSDINGVEMKRERQHHHGVLRARCKGNDDIGDRERKQPRHDNVKDRKSTRLNSSHMSISYAVFCLKKKKAF